MSVKTSGLKGFTNIYTGVEIRNSRMHVEIAKNGTGILDDVSCVMAPRTLCAVMG